MPYDIEELAGGEIHPAHRQETASLAAGGPQERRSAPNPASPTGRAGSGLRIDLQTGIVDLRAIPSSARYEGGEYRRVLDMTTDEGWGWCSSFLGFVVVNRLVVAP